MNKLLIICGPTATGKTSLGIYLAGKLKGEVVSADSRQVYKNMDIGTGKDIPEGAIYKKVNERLGVYYKTDDIRIWGYDLVSPKESFSVAQYTRFAREVIKDIHKRNKLAILVGGTGFYIKSVIEGIETAEIPQNKALRKNLKKLSKEELFEKLAILDASKAGSLNLSDKGNPRRLIRAIEVAIWKLNNLGVRNNKKNYNYDSLSVGLTSDKSVLDEKIRKRIEKRAKGIKKEIENLLKQGIKWSDQSMSSLGYKQWKEYFQGKETEEKTLKKWFLEEKKYSKRQLTWFKKHKEINWYITTNPGCLKNIEKLVKKWYSSS